MSRNRYNFIYPAVDDEISHQNADNGLKGKSLVEELIALESLVNQGLSNFHDEKCVLDLMRQMAAISVRCIENYGLVERVIDVKK